MFWLSINTFDWYLFQLIVLLKPDINCCNSSSLFWVDKVTTGTYNYVAPFTEEITQSADKVRNIDFTMN